MTRCTNAGILAHASDLAAKFEHFEPDRTEETDALDGLGRAVVDLSDAQKNVDLWVEQARAQKKTWGDIGEVLGVSGEAVRQKYGDTSPAFRKKSMDSRGPSTVKRVPAKSGSRSVAPRLEKQPKR